MSFERLRWRPTVHEFVCATWKFGSKMLTLLLRLAGIGYAGVCGWQNVAIVVEQNGSGASRAVSRSSTGHVCPAVTSRPVVALRFCVIVSPGLLAKTPVKVPIESRLYAIA